jgi:hypothetical protein
MRKHTLWLVPLLLVGIVTVVWAQSSNFPTSLHKNRTGKDYWYGTANGGFETFTGVPIEDLGCVECHGPTDANGSAYPAEYSPDCVDCHIGSVVPPNISQDQCYSCHGRQKTEAFSLGYSDVHRTAGFVCWDCHSSADIHGDGTSYDSMLQPGAIDADCTNSGCHPAGSLPGTHAANDPHSDKLHCTSCHAQTVLSCYNCHFESQVDSHVKRAKQPLHDFVILANRTEDGKVYPMTFQSLTYQGDAFAAFGPFTSHTITKDGARICTDCHVNQGGTNDAIEQYNATGEIQFATWNDVDSTLSWLHGVVPMPEDYETSWKMDFITYNGATSDPPVASKNWSKIGKDTWDGHQMFFATPLTADQMAALGMGRDDFKSSLHGTRAGKDYWYGTANGGFETFTGVPIEDLGCVECHGPTDAEGNAYPVDYEPGCVDCHNGPVSPANVSQDQCYSCHGRQKTEAFSLGYSDVHRTAGFVCWDCHGDTDLHGDGVADANMFEPGAITADCTNSGCHDGPLPPAHSGYDPHSNKLHCTSCHAQTVLSCYNCHFESQVVSHVKRAKQPLHDFVMLANRTEDNKVYPITFQSLTYQGTAYAAFGPFTSHTITKTGARTCSDCHYNMGSTNAAIGEYNTTGQIKFATWNDVDSTLSWIHGVIPMPLDYQVAWKMDFITYDGATSDPPVASKNWSKIGKDTWDGHQMFYATPLTALQMQDLGMVNPTPVDNPLTGYGLSLQAAQPNPFRGETTLRFTLPERSEVSLSVYDVRGRKVVQLVSGAKTAGPHSIRWNASSLPAGVYMTQLRSGDQVRSQQVVVLK